MTPTIITLTAAQKASLASAQATLTVAQAAAGVARKAYFAEVTSITGKTQLGHEPPMISADDNSLIVF